MYVHIFSGRSKKKNKLNTAKTDLEEDLRNETCTVLKHETGQETKKLYINKSSKKFCSKGEKNEIL